MRKGGDHAAVARALILQVRQLRATKRGLGDCGDKPVEPDGKRRAYILDSIRHPAEVELLRNVSEVVRPTLAETAMYAAHGAQVRSACLSRQVGAALIDPHGNLLATGTNEVPKAGGGLYGEELDARGPRDHRCAYGHRYCSSTREQNALIDELVAILVEANATSVAPDVLQALLKGSRVSQLLEFSRAVHAEMDALLRAGRRGTSTVGTRMFVTTYPCHYCARHLVTAGVDEVQYIEAYPKSRATKLHADAISTDPIDWVPPSRNGDKVLFRPFVGVAPRLYRRAFLKDRELKDDMTGTMTLSEPPWATPWHLGRVSYVELEAKLARPGREIQPSAEPSASDLTDAT